MRDHLTGLLLAIEEYFNTNFKVSTYFDVTPKYMHKHLCLQHIDTSEKVQ